MEKRLISYTLYKCLLILMIFMATDLLIFLIIFCLFVLGTHCFRPGSDVVLRNPFVSALVSQNVLSLCGDCWSVPRLMKTQAQTGRELYSRQRRI